MHIVFIHPQFPGPFYSLARVLGKDPEHQILFITSTAIDKTQTIPGVQTIVYPATAPARGKDQDPVPLHPGISVANVLSNLKKQNLIPDIILGASGPGTTLYVKDVFPDTLFFGFFEWYHSAAQVQATPGAPPESDIRIRMNLRNRNAPILADLTACDHGVCPTAWQKKQFPREFHSKLRILHPGVDTQMFHPLENQMFKTDSLDLSSVKQLVTYTAPLLAPYPGFQRFMESLPRVLELAPEAHVVIAGSDRVTLDNESGKKSSYKSVILEKVMLDPERVHFIDTLDTAAYQMLLQSSQVHVYLESPLVISRSLIEALSCGCLTIAPTLPAVTEIIQDGINGFVADFASPRAISEKIVACLDYPSFMATVRQKARQTALDSFSQKVNLEKMVMLLQKAVEKAKETHQFG